MRVSWYKILNSWKGRPPVEAHVSKKENTEYCTHAVTGLPLHLSWFKKKTLQVLHVLCVSVQGRTALSPLMDKQFGVGVTDGRPTSPTV